MKKSRIAIILITIFIIGIVFLISNNTYKNEQDYLSKNNAVINLEEVDDFSGLEILNKDLNGKKIILTGEAHHLNKNKLIEMKLLKYLKKEVGVSHYLAEASYSSAHFLNKYLESGDENILKNYFEKFEGTIAYNEDFYNSYKDLYEYNQTLPENDRIKLVGIDIEPRANVSHEYIMDVVKDNSILTEPLKKLLYELKNLVYRDEEGYRKTIIACDEAEKDIAINEAKYKEIFKEDFEGFKHVLKNIRYMSDCYLKDRADWNNTRDKYI